MTRVVVKMGGHALDRLDVDAPVLAALASDAAHLVQGGTDVALVHGGGPQIETLLTTAKIPSRFHEGLRITDAETMSYVAMALGHVNVLLSAAMNHAGLASVGLSGADGSLFVAKSLGEPWLRAGATPSVSTGTLTTLWASGFTPIISSLAVDEQGALVNCNADTAAGALAGALDVEALVLLSDIDQVRAEVSDELSSLSHVSAAQVREMIATGAAREGMVPKLNAALDALEAGATRVLMANGTRPHALRDALAGSIPTTEVVA